MEKQKNQQPDSVISYHNKDIVSKLFGEKLKHKSFESREIQTFVFTGLLVFTDKVILKEDSEKIRRWLEMTKVGQIIEEEIQQAIAETEKETARKMLACGISIDQILQCIDGLTRGELEKMKR